MNPDVLIEIRFKTTAEGGRKGPVTGEIYGAPLFVDDVAFDCRLLLGGLRLELGNIYELPVVFMNPRLVLPSLVHGKPIILWEGREVATGRVIRVLA